jgi:GNAT superfamily N-acetyltransferase
MPEDGRVRRATSADEARVVESLARAFDADEPFNWGIRQDSGRAHALRLAFRAIFRRYLGFGASFVVGDGAGSALWANSDQWEVPFWRDLLLLPLYLRCSGFSRFAKGSGTLDAMKAHHPRGRHRYLFIMGVDPTCQGRGYGSELLKHTLDDCDRSVTPAYLEATCARNIALYTRHGFVPTVEFPCAGGGPTLTGMWREARTLRTP